MPPTEPAWHTEADLRGTLVAVADRDEPDVGAFRTRLAAAEAAPAGDDAVADEVIEIGPSCQSSDARARRRTRFVTTKALAIAACVAAVLLVAGVALGLSRGGSSHGPADPGATLPVPHSVLPGSVTLGQYSGVGPSSIPLPHYRLPAHFELTAYVTCHGTGGIRISGSASTSCGNDYGRGFSSSARTLVVAVRAHTVWRLSVVRDPTTRTNGVVVTPANPEFAHPTSADELGRGSGRGSGAVRARAALTGDRQPQILLTCHGDGVTITSTRAGFPKVYTHTCFAGSDYEFQLEPGMLPATLRISASAATTWRLIVVDN
jgi:hypothetical protein